SATDGMPAVRRDATRRRSLQRLRPREAWSICIPDKYPAYVPWPEWERIQVMLDQNRSEYARERTRGVPREGSALLHGLVYCGESGAEAAGQLPTDGTVPVRRTAPSLWHRRLSDDSRRSRRWAGGRCLLRRAGSRSARPV